jgi:hypothetical protein
MKKLLYLLSVLLILSSCEKEDLVPVYPGGDNTNGTNSINTTGTPESVISHFYDIVSVKRSGLESWYEPRKMKGTVNVYLHSSVGKSDSIVIHNFLNEVKDIINNDGVEFVITRNKENYTLGIVNGGPTLFNNVFDNDATFPNYYVGAATYERDYSGDCTKIQKAQLWYDMSHSPLIKHEILHCLGFLHADHANSDGSIMYHMINDMEPNMTENDKNVLKLLYYDGDYGSVVETGVTECTEDIMYMDKEESDEFKELLKLIIENDYN